MVRPFWDVHGWKTHNEGSYITHCISVECRTASSATYSTSLYVAKDFTVSLENVPANALRNCISFIFSLART